MFKSRVGWLCLGLVLGIVIGMNVAGLWPQVAVHAVATHGENSFAICTGPVDEDVEGVFFLDYLTGDLRGAVLNVQNAQFKAFYEYNVLKDLGTKAKNPHFLMVTGMANLRRGAGAGNMQPAKTVIYVAELVSGQVVAYGLQWNKANATAGVQPIVPFVKLAQTKFRNVPIREGAEEEE